MRNYYNDELSDDKISEIIQRDFKSDRFQIEIHKKYPKEVKSDGWILVGGGKSKNSQRSIEDYNRSCWY